ncbi:DUF5985 family protein [Reyranella sp.]|jgi:hypothetical protein|uniref:DUF5985 family protein n=1 Tax=Reyranella sp. TaxID=1929291 RepID=UPI002F95EB29
MDALSSMLVGAASTLSLVAALFFLRFWRRTHDGFFLLFSIAFAIDALTRFILGWAEVPDESQPYYYLPRLVMFGLIIVAVIQKNRPRAGR